RAAGTAHTGIDHGEMHRAPWKEGDGVPQHERAGENVLGRDAVGDVDGGHARSARRDHTLQDADERIDQSEVGGERDQRSASSTAAHSSGNMISWWPVSWMPRPPIAVGRAITLTAGRSWRWKSMAMVVRGRPGCPGFGARWSAFTKPSGSTTAEPRFMYTPRSSPPTTAASCRKSRMLPSPIAAPSASGCMWTMSVPTA